MFIARNSALEGSVGSRKHDRNKEQPQMIIIFSVEEMIRRISKLYGVLRTSSGRKWDQLMISQSRRAGAAHILPHAQRMINTN